MFLPRTNLLPIVKILSSVSSYKRIAKVKDILVSAVQYVRHFVLLILYGINTFWFGTKLLSCFGKEYDD